MIEEYSVYHLKLISLDYCFIFNS